ncbi:hypothetical protein TGME49_209020 [Toxoplasma gondii ME49]|uniref:Uncharacterized protein n=3 Tax=Toxoplasma gondii TaxID=5811 RepID=A0A125YZA7_TOXGV|nr:hypothetical protein TGME49_209020 [Toxoplasma gondii ME49]EPT32355.1 hypothetical protein TGME49_209020 [Toxoplasma gondii ME49]ESS29470.1 hypothetical protein TGVEG_209020 [Toxoplasma gondii VEG]KFG34945.1 hypothetical protein TGDOM2_209020 [Toxoplasma gondii GAB2-2007-GAL-DOM2]CEL71715.1 TPA: hypothetical protein BN1205_039440 [Toxoplasma gondii VEG]|eukprot:XP_018638463.1 hypothetical protein TGME49_209020 [Toxoplasma gondii ME49]
MLKTAEIAWQPRVSPLRSHASFNSVSAASRSQASLPRQLTMGSTGRGSTRSLRFLSVSLCKQASPFCLSELAVGAPFLTAAPTHREAPLDITQRSLSRLSRGTAEGRRRGCVGARFPQTTPGESSAETSPPLLRGTFPSLEEPRGISSRRLLCGRLPSRPSPASASVSDEGGRSARFQRGDSRLFGAFKAPVSPGVSRGKGPNSSCFVVLDSGASWVRGSDVFTGPLGSTRSKHFARSSSKTNPLALSTPRKERSEKTSPKREQAGREKRPGLFDELLSTFESFRSRETQKMNSSASVLGVQSIHTRSDANAVLSRFQAAIQPGGWDTGIPLVPFLLLAPLASLLVYAFLWKSLWRPLKREEERTGRLALTRGEDGKKALHSPSPKPFSLSLVPLYASDLLSHLGPFLAKHVESRGVCKRALSELQDPLLAREAKGSALAALQTMLQYPSIARHLCSTKIGSRFSSPSSCPPASPHSPPGETDDETEGHRGKKTQDTGTELKQQRDKTPLEIVLSVFVGENLPEGIVKQSTEWLLELSCLCTILRHTPPEDREVPYDLLLRLVNANASLWAHEPSFEELRGRILLKLLENTSNALTVYDREAPQLQARSVESDSGHQTEKDELSVPEKVLSSDHGSSADLAERASAKNESSPEHASSSSAPSDASDVETQEEKKGTQDTPRLVLDLLLHPGPYTTPDSIFLQLWPVGQRIRAGEPEHALRRAVKLLRSFVEARDEARISERHASDELRENSVSLSSSASSFWSKLRGRESRKQAGEKDASGDYGAQDVSPLSAALLLCDTSLPSPRRSPPWRMKLLLRELETDLLCVLSVVFLGVFSRKSGGESLFGEVGKIALTGIRALRGLAILEAAYHLETNFIHSPAYYEATDSDMIKQSLGLVTFNGLLAAAVFRTHKYALLPFFLLRIRDMFAMDFRI